MPPKSIKKDLDQPSISNFFKKTPTESTPSAVSGTPRKPSSVSETAGTPRKRQKVDSATPIDIDSSSDGETDFRVVSPVEAGPSGTKKTTLIEVLPSGSELRAKAIETTLNPSRTALKKYTAPKISYPEDEVVAATPTGGPSAAPKYLYDANLPIPPSEDDQAAKERKRRHQRWQKKLDQGLIAPRRNSLPLDQAAAENPDENDPDFEMLAEDLDSAEAGPSRGTARGKTAATSKSAGKGKKKEELGPSGMSYTPLEKQFMEIKADNPDVLLLMEVGYKYKFHGDDAKIASRELGIACFPMRNFYSASIPVHRLHIHVKKLIARGHKVGVVTQTETAALKAAGDNRNKPFERRMTALYTAATYVDDSSLNDDDLLTDPSRTTNAFICINERNAGRNGVDDHVWISLIAVVIGTGDVVYDDFKDTHLRNELETRLMHLSPTEILLPQNRMSKATEKVIASWAEGSENATGTGTRIERQTYHKTIEKAWTYLRTFYRSDDTEVDGTPIDLDEAVDEDQPSKPPARASQRLITCLESLPVGVIPCIAASVEYLERFELKEALLHVEAFSQFATVTSMLLSANTLGNLEIYRNQTDYSVKGSLLWLMDNTKTKMGKRMLRDWIGRPLVNIAMLEERLDAITELKDDNTLTLEKLKGLLKGAMPDLGRGLSRIQYGRATPGEAVSVLIAFQRLADEFQPDLPTGTPKSGLLSRIASSFPKIREPVVTLLSGIDIRKAKADKPEDMFTNQNKYSDITAARAAIENAETSLDNHLKEIRQEVKMGSLQFVTVAGIDHLIEVRLKHVVPANWVKISATKHVTRYHTPFVISASKELEQGRESLLAAGKAAFKDWQQQIAQHYNTLREATLSLATLDCLVSLTKVAIGTGSEYCRPSFIGSESMLDFRGVRHPMSEVLVDDYVANDVNFSDKTSRLAILTGPNMAGKTSLTRAVALCLVMAQVGSYVPCDSATLSVHDSIWTRMGASDDIARGRSTFMVELKETSEILAGVTSKSFVILDELGRGTSTADGTAIAWAVIDRLVELKCNTIFTTHFPALARIQEQHPGTIIVLVAKEISEADAHQCTIGAVSVMHMGFTEVETAGGSPEIVFLYKLMPSLSHRSFGTYVGRLAGLPASVLERADERSEWMREKAKRRWISHLRDRIQGFGGEQGGRDQIETGDHDIVDLLSAVTRVKVM